MHRDALLFLHPLLRLVLLVLKKNFRVEFGISCGKPLHYLRFRDITNLLWCWDMSVWV